ncbi:non-ribosomal peptide synthetase [Tolypothrix campylonemoides VB511288]|nr:non-ribosomal peptide synthetase [Tolypothrix campylonemoides VB511288]
MDNITDIYELSPMQQGMLFHTLYAPNSGVYFQQLICTLDGDLQVSALQQAWEEVVTRHPVLRTSFHWDELDKPLQVVHAKVNLPWEQQNWLGLTEDEQEKRLEAFLESDRQLGFDLNQAPLMRFTLIQVAETTWQLVWSNHHLLLDGWCLSIIFKEVFAFYEAFSQGKDIYLDITSRPYRDYIAWLQQQNLAQAEAFWRQTLWEFNVPTPLFGSKSFNGISTQEEKYDQQHLWVSETLFSALQTLARQHHLTISTFIQGVWALLLSYYSGESDVVFGVTVSGRPATLLGVESMVGLFINTLPARVQVSNDLSLMSWLQQLQAQQVEREQYAHTPLIDIQGWSDVPRGMALFESIVVFENYPLEVALQEQVAGLSIQNVRSLEHTNYPLTLEAMPAGQKLCLTIEYDSDRFDAATISRILGHFQTLLENIVNHPEQRISELSPLTVAERHQLLVEWNNTLVNYPQNKCIHELFEAQVERTPDAVAVVFEEQQLTYRELNAQANQLAHRLQALGVRPEVLVGIYIERSLKMLVGLLGILKAGGAYVPLDPAYPQERLAFMLEDSQVALLLTQKSLVNSLPKHEMQVICLDSDWETIATESVEKPLSLVTSENLAYVIYTSGSTGKPKGVMIEHKSLVNYTQTASVEYALQPCDRILQFSSISWDTSAEDIYPCLAVGATLVLRTPSMLDSVSTFLQKCQDWSLTVVNLPTAYWHELTAHLGLTKVSVFPKSLRLVIIGGEAVLRERLITWYKHVSQDVRLVNAYGLTETTAVTTICELSRSAEVDAALQEVTIGRPIHNVQVYVLNQYLQPVPIGVPGELYISGAGLARGYLNHSDLTLEKFIPNPFSDDSGGRLYKTGDLVRYLPNGNIEFLGRIDHQVKIRGFRIELEEIEAILSQHPEVRESAIIVCEDKLGNKRLVAYVVPNQEKLSTIEVRRFLKQKLPDYMVPAAFVVLKILPLTPNGKVDRKALPIPEVLQNSLEQEYVAPRTPEEEVLTQIWAEVLGLERVGIYDNFFELGGHSLLATQLISRLQQTFGVNLPIRSLFETPDVSGLVKVLIQHETEPGKVAATARLQQKLNQMSDEEIQAMLQTKFKVPNVV